MLLLALLLLALFACCYGASLGWRNEEILELRGKAPPPAQ